MADIRALIVCQESIESLEMNVQLAPRPVRFNVEQFNRMSAAGIFARDARIELVEGEVVEMAPVGARHGRAIDALSSLLAEWHATRRGPAYEICVAMQSPVRISPFSEFQPDVTLLSPTAQDYQRTTPLASSVLCLIEVADTSLRFDTTVKLPIYAANGVAEVWILDLRHGRLEVYRKPLAEGRYEAQRTVPRGTAIAPTAMPELKLNWTEALVAADAAEDDTPQSVQPAEFAAQVAR